MTKERVVHSTIVVERRFKVAPARVFAAWADASARAQWNVPGEGWELAELQQDFRVGGRETARFGPKGNPVHWSAGHFLDIVPDERIVSAGTMHDGETRSSATLCTIEFVAENSGTLLVLTDQSAFLGAGEMPADRKSGWGKIIDRLELYLLGADTSTH